MPQRLGQHFLKDARKINKIIDALLLSPSDIVIEIGPGRGALTKKLINHNISILAIEKDVNMVNFIEKNFEFTTYKSIEATPLNFSLSNRIIFEGDALLTIPKITHKLSKSNTPYKIVGNIPYYITGRLFRVLGELQHPPTNTILTIQKQVAERVCEVPPRMNLLASCVQYWATPKIVCSIPKRAFNPPPKIDSAVISLSTKPKKQLCTRDHYYEFVKKLFQHPRKTVLNNTRDYGEKILNALSYLKIDPNSRPHNISIPEIISIVKILYN